MKTIEIKTTGAGATVAFPFELKDAFRNAFPSAKWNAAAKVWTVGTRSITRLNDWADKIRASGILAELEVNEELELSNREIDRLSVEIAKVRDMLKAAQATTDAAAAARARAVQLSVELEGMKAELAYATKMKIEAEAAATEAERSVAEVVATVASETEITMIRNGMVADARRPSPSTREAFVKKRARMAEILSELNRAGLTSAVVRRSAAADWNRTTHDQSPLRIAVEFELVKIDA